MRIFAVLFLMFVMMPSLSIAKIIKVGGIYFADDISPSQRDFETARAQRELLILDLQRLRSVIQVGPHANLQRALSLPRVSRESLVSWLEKRVRTVVRDLNDDYSNVLYYTKYSEVKIGSAGAFEVAKNQGALLYVTGKMRGELKGVSLPGFKKNFPVKTPRIGYIMYSPRMFAVAKNYGIEDPKSLAASLFRLSSFWFHEARHSDGNGDNVGFLHHEVDGVDYDVFRNGPYAINGYMAEMLAENCDQCTPREKGGLREMASDCLDLVLSHQWASPRQEAPEFLE